jgi:transcriptional regulator with XRE-family HTH domain
MNETATHKELGRWIGVSGSMVGYWFKNQRRLSIDSAQRLESLVGVPWTELLTYAPEDLERVIRDAYASHRRTQAV